MNLYFFATLAICAAWIDWRAILGYTAVVAVHHLVLDFVIPFAVFPEQSDILRVLLHAVILVLESGVLVAIAFAFTSSLLRAEEATEAAAAQLRGDDIAQQQMLSASMEMERIQLCAKNEAAASEPRRQAIEAIARGLGRLASGERCFELSELNLETIATMSDDPLISLTAVS